VAAVLAAGVEAEVVMAATAPVVVGMAAAVAPVGATARAVVATAADQPATPTYKKERFGALFLEIRVLLLPWAWLHACPRMGATSVPAAERTASLFTTC
jgi:hypothetical protein